MKCYYEILGVARDAEQDTLKQSYRKLALKCHPDKNPDDPTAKEQFQLLQNAYEVLSDPQERAWYDNHREQLLRGAGSTFNDDSLDLIPFFTASCYKGFGDDDNGFYAVYREVFNKLAAEEVDYLDDPEEVKSIPVFGKSDTPYETVHEFYSYWMSFSTSKSYVWLDKYDIREADNRKVLKLLEKENNKIRQKARKERNDEIRELVNFIRKRDKRVIAHTKLLQEKAEENKKKTEKLRNERIAKRHKELVEETKNNTSVYSLNDFHEQLSQIEKDLADVYGNSDEDTLTGPSDQEYSDDNESSKKNDLKENNISSSQSLYCTACNKLFKNIKSFQNHENSKKHKENVINLKMDTNLNISEDENSAASPQDESNKKSTVESDELELSDDVYNAQPIVQSKKKKRKNKKVSVLHEQDSDTDHLSNLDDLSGIVRSRRARKAKAMEKVISSMRESKLEQVNDNDILADDENSQEAEDSSKGVDDPPADQQSSPDSDKDKNTNKKCNTSKKSSSAKTKHKKTPQKQKLNVLNAANVVNIDTSLCCAICKAEFPSKNKLFDHLKKTGHQVYLPNSSSSSADASKAKSSRK